MPKRIFIGGLSATATESDLQKLCGGLDGLQRISIEGGADGSRQAIVDFSSDEMGTAALRRLQGERIDGNALRVSEQRH